MSTPACLELSLEAETLSSRRGESYPTLSIIIVNHDGADDTLGCIDSIYGHPPSVPFEIVVIDNFSRDGLLEALSLRHPEVQVHVNTRREGFASNYNRGMALSRGRYLLVLNNDTLIHAGALDCLLATMEQDAQIGMAGPLLLDSRAQVQVDCARPAPSPGSYLRDQIFTDMGLPLGRLYGRLLRRSIRRRPTGPVAAISGACMLVSREALAEVGPLDADYRFYYEDTDWCARFNAHGYQIVFAANARITHLGDQSARKVKVWAKQQEYLGALRYFQRHWSLTPWLYRLIRSATLYNWLVRGLLMLLAEALTGKAGGARAYLYLWHWLWRHQGYQAPGL